MAATSPVTVRSRRRRSASDWLELGAVAIAVLVIVVAVVGPFITPHDPYQVALDQSLRPPDAKHWFGTDTDGRDVFSRVLAGARVTVFATFVVIAAATVIGVLLGTVAAFGGRVFDEILMRICDIGLSFPAMILALGLAAAMGPSLTSAVVALALTWWPGYARLVRTLVRETLHAEYVDAARSVGMSRWRLIRRHVLPNSLDTLYVQITLDVAAVILVISGLSFIGVGAQPPSAEWGALVAAGRNNVVNGWWVVALPGAAIALTAIAFNLVGDRLRVRRDPTLRVGGRS